MVFEHIIERFRLSDVAWITVEQKSFFHIGMRESLAYDFIL